jgi:ATP-dependent DNA ligase
MLATLVARPFQLNNWVYEEKYDGDRLLAYKEGTWIRLLSRNAKDCTIRFPNIVASIRKLKPVSLLLDGEVVVFDRKRISRFQLLQQEKGEPTFAVFDCLYIDGRDLRHEPLSERRRMLEGVVTSARPLLLSHRLDKNGLKAYEYQQFKPLIRTNSAFSDPPLEKGIVFLAPRLVGQISYQELTADHRLRQPVFLGLRDDKRVGEVLLPTSGG